MVEMGKFQTELDLVAKQIADLPSHKRDGWVCYLLEALDDLPEQEAEILFEQVMVNLDRRLMTGGW